MANLNSLVVRTNGSIDTSASLTAIGTALTAEIEREQAAVIAIAPTVDAVFEAHAGQRVSIQFVLTQVGASVDAASIRSVQAAAKSYIAQQIAAGELNSKKGRVGGTCRAADVATADAKPVTPAAPVTEA